MSTLALNNDPIAVDVEIDSEKLKVILEDGRELSVPTEWFPRLREATDDQRRNWRFIGRGEGLHWEDLDEDISIEGLLAGYGDTSKRNAAE